MSTDTKAALDAAIRAHIADEHDDSLTASWVLIAERMPDLDRKSLRAAMRMHTASTRYLKAVERAQQRFVEASGDATARQRAHVAQGAAAQLRKRRVMGQGGGERLQR